VIPTLITSIMNRPDYLDRLIDSIDVPVGRGLIVDNGRTGYPAPVRTFLTPEGQHDEHWAVMQPPFASLGWPGTLNFGITQTPAAPWWLLVNNDAWFEPGKLALLCERMAAQEAPAVLHHEWTVVALPLGVVERVGLFDEWSFSPLYFDDTDYARRCALAGIAVEEGDWCLEGDEGRQHAGTVRSDPELARANNLTWVLNRAAYVAKWGGPPGRETFDTPWNQGLPLWATKPDLWGRMARTW
jgi:hypothetical protein